VAFALLGALLFVGFGYLVDRQRRLRSLLEHQEARVRLLERAIHSPEKKAPAVRLPPSVQSVLAGLEAREEPVPPAGVGGFRYEDPDKTSVSALLDGVRALSLEGAEEARTWVMGDRTRVGRVRDGRPRG
jgi:hypothetical protein